MTDAISKTRAKRQYKQRESFNGNQLWVAYYDLSRTNRAAFLELLIARRIPYDTFICDTLAKRRLRDIAAGRLAVYAAYFETLGIDLYATVRTEMGLAQDPADTSSAPPLA